MPNLDYEAVEALIYDPMPDNRRAMRASLASLGFRHVDGVSAPVDFAYANYRRNPDIVFCEILSNETMMCDQIQALRCGQIGNNPFVVVVATTSDTSAAVIKRVINAGADDLILRPFSTETLAGRLEALAERRKGFVVTHDYVGPDRRRDPKRVSSGLFEPPNSFRIKAYDHLPLGAAERKLAKELQSAKSYLFNAKLRADVFQIGVLGRLLPSDPRGQEAFLRHRDRLTSLTRSVQERGDQAKIAGVDMWCREILSAAKDAETDADPSDSFRFLDRAAANLYLIANPIKTLEDYQATLANALQAIVVRQARGKPV